MAARFFRSASAFRAWLKKHHASAQKIEVEFYKKDSSKKGIMYKEAVDEALCFGWIDGIRRRIDDHRYANRFTPRRKRSMWSNVNIKRVGELEDEGRMTPAGRIAFQARDPKRSSVYAFEQRKPELSSAKKKTLKANAKAWAFFQSQAP